MIDTNLFCADSVPVLWGILDPAIAPPLLYYSYLPIIIVSLLFGLLVLLADKASLRSRLLFWVSVAFSLYLLNELIHWIAVLVVHVHFAWQMTALIHVILVALIASFVTVYLYDRLPGWFGWVLALIFAPIILATPTIFNIPAFDFSYCEGLNGPIWTYVYAVEVLALLYVVAASIIKSFRVPERARKWEALLLGFGGLLFLGMFTVSNVVGDLTLTYDFNLFGPLGMVAFLTAISYLIVRYRAFNMRVLAAQMLIAGLIILLFAALFVRSIENVRYVLIGTLILVFLLGWLLVRSVKREVEQRRRIEKLAHELEATNERQETLIHFISHEVKGFLNKDMVSFAALSEGDLGPLPAPMKQFVDQALMQSREGANSVIGILQASNQKKGTVTYKKEPVDMQAITENWFKKVKPVADNKGLAMTLAIDPSGAPYTITGDAAQLGDHVLRNVIENSVNYTPSGSVTVSLSKANGKVVFTVQDTGVGINAEDKKRLFTEGGRGKDSLKVNVHSTGYGLFIAKNIVDAHGGTIRAESEGPGKGSKFVIELPATA